MTLHNCYILFFNPIFVMILSLIFCLAIIFILPLVDTRFIDCSYPVALGMESGVISDGQLSCVTYKDWPTSPAYARLNGPGAWQPKRLSTSTTDEWLKVDFKVKSLIF